MIKELEVNDEKINIIRNKENESFSQRGNIQRLSSLQCIFLKRENTVLFKSMSIILINDQRIYLKCLQCRLLEIVPFQKICQKLAQSKS